MSNLLNISIKIEKDISIKNNQFIENEKQPIGYQVYANVDAISCWIGGCTDIESLEEIVSPEELISSIQESASESEFIELMASLEFNNYKYMFFDEIRIAKQIR